MDKFKIDYLTKEEMYISEKRSKRPVSYKNQSSKDFEVLSKENCPFCEGKEDILGSIILQHKEVRIVENIYPAIEHKYGKHEVLIESLDHSKKYQDFDESYCNDIFVALYERYRELSKKYKYINIFKNEGFLSGATLYHTHWQIMALDRVTPKNNTIYNSFCDFRKENGYDYFNNKNTDYLTLFLGKAFKIVVPSASKFHLMLRIVPIRNIKSFGEFNMEELFEASSLLNKVLKVYKKEMNDFSYNINFHDFDNREVGHFFIEILPRHGKYGGFELMSDAYLTSGYGERTVEVLKKYFT
ncbi:MAG: DUF4931 domain-containing protein [Lachnospirales bacterium]